MTQIEHGGVAVLLSASKGLDECVDALRSAPGFLGGTVFKPVGFVGEKLAYTRWRDRGAAEGALDSGDVATLRATPVDAISVRLKSAPDDRRSTLVLDEPGTVLLRPSDERLSV